MDTISRIVAATGAGVGLGLFQLILSLIILAAVIFVGIIIWEIAG
ncbi:MAG: hypothetical protein ABSF48_10805 [Thermodesulfobacteriota bacterium]|jgi:hypothetical protein